MAEKDTQDIKKDKQKDSRMLRLESALSSMQNEIVSLKSSTIKKDHLSDNELVLEPVIGGYIITVNRDGTKIIKDNITDALLALANYCGQKVIVNDKSNYDPGDEEDEN